MRNRIQLLIVKHAHKDGSGQKKHGNRNGKGKRPDSEYERLRREFKAKEKRQTKASEAQSRRAIERNRKKIDTHLRRVYRRYQEKPSDGVGTRKHKEAQRKYARGYASYRRGTRKTDPAESFGKWLTASDLRSIRTRVDGAFARGMEDSPLPPRRDKISDPDSMRGTVGAEGYTDRKVRTVKPTGKVKRKRK